MNFSVEQLEYFILIFVRLSGFIFTAPFFSQKNVPARVKTGLTFFVAVIVFMSVEYKPLTYIGIIGFGALILKEVLMGIILGFMTNICSMIVAFAGQLVDQEIGFSMVQELNPAANIQTTITANLFSTSVMLVMLISNLYLHIVSAIIDSFRIVEIGEVFINPLMYKVMLVFIVDYFLIAFRIILPIFVCILLTNVVLAILAKVAPQMNMFVIGMQLKVFVGLAVLMIIATMITAVTDFIYSEMKTMIKYSIDFFKGF